MTRRLVNVEAAARRLNVAPRTVRKYVKEGVIAHVRMGHLILFEPRHLEDFVRARTVPADRKVAAS